jgi:hypothetical protein
MKCWRVRMTFEGFMEADVSREAIELFKTKLGLAPAAMRSEVHMVDLQTTVVDKGEEVAPDVEWKAATL